MKGNSSMLYGIIIFLVAVCFVLTCFIAVCAKHDRENQAQTEERLQTYKAYNAELINANNTLSVELKAFREENKRLAEDNEGYLQILKKMLAERERTEQAEQTVQEEQPEPEKLEEEKPRTVTANGLIPYGVPTNFFCCEPYDRFNKSSAQYRLQQECMTEPETGLRVYIDKNGKRYYTAALAGAYGTEIGRAYAVELQNGTQFNVMLSDYKHPIDDARADDYGDWAVNYDGEDVLCVIEFITDMALLPKVCKDAGTMSALPMFGGLYGHGGNIVSMEDLGRVWHDFS